MADTKKAMQCGHCGKLAAFIIRGQGSQNGTVPDYNYKDGQEITEWRILECEQCKKPTLAEVKIFYSFEIDDVYGGMEPTSFVSEILYPEAKAPLTNLPKTIEKRYMDALGSKDVSPSAFAVLAGKTLETVCNYEHMTGSTLEKKLKNLIGSDRIPPVLAQMAQQIRQIRNLGAHDAEDDATEEDVPIILDFLEAILEYLYVAPAKIAALQARLAKTP